LLKAGGGRLHLSTGDMQPIERSMDAYPSRFHVLITQSMQLILLVVMIHMPDSAADRFIVHHIDAGRTLTTPVPELPHELAFRRR
jgi:hypothetical protein